MVVLKKYFPIILVFIITLSIRIFWVCQKDYVFVDEPVNFSVISPNTIHNGQLFKTFNYQKFNFKINYEYDTKTIKYLLFNHGNDFKTLFKDLKSLYLYDYDSGHSNLYYMFLRVWTFNLKNVEINTINFYGFTFNLLLFSISFFIMFKLLQLIVDDKRYIPLYLLISFISTSSVSNTLFVREYQLQSLGMLLVTYIFIKIYLSIDNNKNLNILNTKNILLYSFAFTFYFLTGYYSVVYAFILLLIVSFKIYKNIKIEKTDYIKIFLIVFLSVIFVFCIDRNYLNITQEIEKISNNNFLSLKFFERELFTAFDMMQKTIFYPILMLYILILFLFSQNHEQNNNMNSLVLIIFNCSLTWSFIVLFISPVYGIRYFIPATSLLSLGFIYILQKFNFKYTIIFCLMSLILIFIPNVRFNNFDTIRPFLFYVHDHNNFVFNNRAKIPVVFRDYRLPFETIILNTDDEQKVLFVDDIPNKNFRYKEYILFYKKDNLEKYQTKIKQNKIVSTGCTKFDDCYVIINNN